MKRVLWTVPLIGLIMTAPYARAAEKMSAVVFGRDPTRFIDHQIRIDKLGCFFSPEAGYRCTTYAGAYVLLGDVAPASVRAKIKAECGGIVEDEDDPSCLFDLVFTPSGSSKGIGQIVKGGRAVQGAVWMVKAASATLSLHR